MTSIEIIFWLSLFVILYAYAGYTALLWLVSRFTMHKESEEGTMNEEGSLPSVTLMISAYNEERVIGDKVNNALSLEYPRELLEIVVVSDGSSDRTTEIVSKFAHRGVVLRHYEGRIGKTACLNKAVPLAMGSVIVFSDANSIYDGSALKALVRSFQDSTVGFVTGWTKYGSGEDMASTDSLGIYSWLELITKKLESSIGSCIGADGAIFAIRKELYVPLKDYDINDFVIPLTINRQGYRGILQEMAFCFEKDAGGDKGEFHRQVRIANRTIRAIVNHRELLNLFRFRFFSIALLSHKLCRFIVPLFMVGLISSNLILLSRSEIYLIALIGQVLLYTGASLTAIVPRSGFLAPLAEAAKTFVVVNVAILFAWMKYWQGETYTTWSPTQR